MVSKSGGEHLRDGRESTRTLVHAARLAHVLESEHLHPVEQDGLHQAESHRVREVLRVASLRPGGQVSHPRVGQQLGHQAASRAQHGPPPVHQLSVAEPLQVGGVSAQVQRVKAVVTRQAAKEERSVSVMRISPHGTDSPAGVEFSFRAQPLRRPALSCHTRAQCVRRGRLRASRSGLQRHERGRAVGATAPPRRPYLARRGAGASTVGWESSQRGSRAAAVSGGQGINSVGARYWSQLPRFAGPLHCVHVFNAPASQMCGCLATRKPHRPRGRRRNDAVERQVMESGNSARSAGLRHQTGCAAAPRASCKAAPSHAPLTRGRALQGWATKGPRTTAERVARTGWWRPCGAPRGPAQAARR